MLFVIIALMALAYGISRWFRFTILARHQRMFQSSLLEHTGTAPAALPVISENSLVLVLSLGVPRGPQTKY